MLPALPVVHTVEYNRGMSERRDKFGRGIGFAIIIVGLPVLYMLGMGILSGSYHRGIIERDTVAFDFYWRYAAPARFIYQSSPDVIRNALDWYYDLWH